MIQIDVPQGSKKPSIPVTVRGPVSVVVTPKAAPKLDPIKPKPKKTPSVIDVILQGVLPIATNPIIPGTSTPLLPTQPGRISTPLPGVSIDPTKPITVPSLPVFPDLGLPSIGDFGNMLKKPFEFLGDMSKLVLIGGIALGGILLLTRS